MLRGAYDDVVEKVPLRACHSQQWDLGDSGCQLLLRTRRSAGPMGARETVRMDWFDPTVTGGSGGLVLRQSGDLSGVAS